MLTVPKRLRKHDGLKAAHRYAPQHEKATAKRLGGKITAGSGNKFEKGDVRVNGIMRAELKCTSADSFRVTRKMLDKIRDAARARNEIPAMEIQFLTPEGQPGECFAVVPREVLDLLVKVSRDAS